MGRGALALLAFTVLVVCGQAAEWSGPGVERRAEGAAGRAAGGDGGVSDRALFEHL